MRKLLSITVCLVLVMHCKEDFALDHAENPELTDEQAIQKIVEACTVRTKYDIRSTQIARSGGKYRASVVWLKSPDTATQNLDLTKETIRDNIADFLLCAVRVGSKRDVEEVTLGVVLVFSDSPGDEQEVYRYSLKGATLGQGDDFENADVELVSSEMTLLLDNWEGIGFTR